MSDRENDRRRERHRRQRGRRYSVESENRQGPRRDSPDLHRSSDDRDTSNIHPDRRRNLHEAGDDYHRSERRRHRSRDGRPSPEWPRQRRRSRSPPPSDRDEGGHRSRTRDDRQRSNHDRQRDTIDRSRSGQLSRRPNDGHRPSSTSPLPPAPQDEIEPAPPAEEEKKKQAPNYKPTGLLAAETNTVANTSIVLKYNEPPEARKPPSRDAWRLFVFKPPPAPASGAKEKKADAQLLDTVELADRSCWLVGRERAVVDFLVEHPSCSKQHAVLQFRYVVKTDEWGEKKGNVKPYIIDLESANGTIVNGDQIPPTRYMELRSGDLVQFGHSTREYVLMLPPPGEQH